MATDETRNPEFADPARGKGFKAQSMPGKNPEEAVTMESHDTPPEKATNVLKEYKG